AGGDRGVDPAEEDIADIGAEPGGPHPGRDLLAPEAARRGVHPEAVGYVEGLVRRDCHRAHDIAEIAADIDPLVEGGGTAHLVALPQEEAGAAAIVADDAVSGAVVEPLAGVGDVIAGDPAGIEQIR